MFFPISMCPVLFLNNRKIQCSQYKNKIKETNSNESLLSHKFQIYFHTHTDMYNNIDCSALSY